MTGRPLEPWEPFHRAEFLVALGLGGYFQPLGGL
jgi:hypothetical protein